MGSAKDVNQGDYFKIKNDIFMVIRKEVIAVGTHSHTRNKLTVQNLNGGGERQMVFSHEDKLDTIDVKRIKGQVVLKSASSVQVMDLFTYETSDADIAPELLKEINEGDIVSLVDVEGRKRVTNKLRNA